MTGGRLFYFPFFYSLRSLCGLLVGDINLSPLASKEKTSLVPGHLRQLRQREKMAPAFLAAGSRSKPYTIRQQCPVVY